MNRRRKALTRPLARLLGFRSDQTRALIGDVFLRYRALVMLLFLSNIVAALFEASTVGLFVVAVGILVGDQASGLGAAFGSVGGYIDQFASDYGRETIFLALVSMAIIGQLLRSALQYGGIAITAVLQARVTSELQGRAAQKIVDLSYAELSKHPAGAVQTYFTHAGATSRSISQFNNLLSELAIVIAYIAVLSWLSLPMTLVAVIMALVFSASIIRISHNLQNIGARTLKSSIKLGRNLVELLQMPRLIRIFGRQSYAKARIETALQENISSVKKGVLLSGLIAPLLESATFIFGGIFLIGGYLLLKTGTENVMPLLLGFILILHRLMGRVSGINRTRAGLVQMMPTYDRVAEFLGTMESRYERQGGVRFKRLHNRIEFKGISYTYEGRNEKALDNVSFSIDKGAMTAIVGSSGAGKSTIVDLLLGLYEPTQGAIEVDGTPLNKIDLGSWRSAIGVVSQDVSMLHVSIAENIAFGKLDATEEEIIKAAKTAYAHDFIKRLPDGYGTIVGDQGHRLSGGQRQRIALARAIIRNPQILVLDEATSALDSESERQIQRAISELRGRLTILSIAHRLSTIAIADQILVLEDGVLMERGSHKKLRGQGGIYSRFWDIQSHRKIESETESGSKQSTHG